MNFTLHIRDFLYSNGTGNINDYEYIRIALHMPSRPTHVIIQPVETSETLVARLHTSGILLQQDPLLPNVVTLMAGGPVRGSWWAHSDADRIYDCLNEITRHPDVLVTRLARGKITFVHRRLWPAVLTVACSHMPWQTAELSESAHKLYEEVERQGILLSSGQMAKEIARRLLVHDEQVHTPAGHHELRLESWSLWAERVTCPRTLRASEGLEQIEAVLRALGGTIAMLPWGKQKRRSSLPYSGK